MSDQATTRSEVEALPVDPLFNPAHPDYAGWAGAPTPPSPPAEPAASSNTEPPSTNGDPDGEKPAQQPDTASSTVTPTRKR